MCMGTEHGYIYMVDTNDKQSGGRLKEWAAHKNAIYDLKWIDGSKKIVSVGGDNNLCVWDVDQVWPLTLIFLFASYCNVLSK